MQNYEEASSGHSFLFSKFLLKEKNEFIITFLYFKKSNLLIHLESRELSKIADKLLFLQDYLPVFFPPLFLPFSLGVWFLYVLGHREF